MCLLYIPTGEAFNLTDMQRVRNPLMRAIKDIPQKSIVHIIPIRKFIGVQKNISNLLAELRLLILYEIEESFEINIVPHYQEIYPRRVEVKEGSRDECEPHLADSRESPLKLGEVMRRGL